ncbi:hypothetical protein ACQEPW_013225 [Xanthomonas oryzae pv. oryzicola]|uniref:hypothetical protein n=1 Tax=Xanthomonas oryzae TaxID=347 RepID=UPI003D166299
MSAGSSREVEAALLKRYGETYGRNDESFRAGFGVSWAKLKDAISREAAAERVELAAKQLGKKVRSTALPFTAEQAAGLLKLSYKAFNQLARTDGPAGRLVPEQASGRSRVVAAISLVRLLEWAEGVPEVTGWRASRSDGEILGATRTAPEVMARFQDLKNGKVRVVLKNEDGIEVVAWIDLEQRTSVAKAMLRSYLREQARTVEVDERGMLKLETREFALPDALACQWEHPELRKSLLAEYQEELAHVDALLIQQEAEALAEAEELKLRLAILEDAVKTIAAIRAQARSASLEAGLPPPPNVGKKEPFRF